MEVALYMQSHVPDPTPVAGMEGQTPIFGSAEMGGVSNPSEQGAKMLRSPKPMGSDPF